MRKVFKEMLVLVCEAQKELLKAGRGKDQRLWPVSWLFLMMGKNRWLRNTVAYYAVCTLMETWRVMNFAFEALPEDCRSFRCLYKLSGRLFCYIYTVARLVFCLYKKWTARIVVVTVMLWIVTDSVWEASSGTIYVHWFIVLAAPLIMTHVSV